MREGEPTTSSAAIKGRSSFSCWVTDYLILPLRGPGCIVASFISHPLLNPFLSPLLLALSTLLEPPNPLVQPSALPSAFSPSRLDHPHNHPFDSSRRPSQLVHSASRLNVALLLSPSHFFQDANWVLSEQHPGPRLGPTPRSRLEYTTPLGVDACSVDITQ